MSVYTVSDYLVDRLYELGVHKIFGVPGDFNLGFLDHVIAHPDIEWVGNANELNAGYAADGYARLRGIGAFVTTFGVGELSAINAVAGSYAENVPVVHIVGAPSTEMQASRKKIHHTLGDGDFDHFFRIAREITGAQAKLTAANALAEIDRVLIDVITQKLPGYILLSTDVARMAAYPPEVPLTKLRRSVTSKGAIIAFKQALREFLPGKTTTILADLLVHRFESVELLNNLLKISQLPYATLLWGKSLVNESDPLFLGIYAGKASEPLAKVAVEFSEALIAIGVQFTDLTTVGFSQNINVQRIINIELHQSSIGHQVFAPLHLEDAITAVTEVIAENTVLPFPIESYTNYLTEEDEQLRQYFDQPSEPMENITSEKPLTQKVLWEIISQTLEPHNVVLCDQGTPFTGMAYKHLPQDTFLIGQALWGSIGYALAATLGVGLADPNRRPVVLTGDGSAQLSIQELSTIAREQIPAVIILVNNDGYSVERAIHGPTQPYNDIAQWQWKDLPQVLGANPEKLIAVKVTNGKELHAACQLAQDNKDKLVFIEAVTDKYDYPPFLQFLSASIEKFNRKNQPE